LTAENSARISPAGPHFIKDFVEDLFPRECALPFACTRTKTWDSYTGTQHTWIASMWLCPTDAGDWEQMNADACAMNICDPQSRQIDWGSTGRPSASSAGAGKPASSVSTRFRHVEEADRAARSDLERADERSLSTSRATG